MTQNNTHSFILSLSIRVHDLSITISSEKEILLHLEAERVFRVKHMRCTPKQMVELIATGLDHLDLNINDVSLVVMSEDDRRTHKLDAYLKGTAKEEAILLGRTFKPLFADHQSSHIATSYPSGFNDSPVVCADAGSREGSTRFYYKNGKSIVELANFANEITFVEYFLI